MISAGRTSALTAAPITKRQVSTSSPPRADGSLRVIRRALSARQPAPRFSRASIPLGSGSPTGYRACLRNVRKISSAPRFSNSSRLMKRPSPSDSRPKAMPRPTSASGTSAAKGSSPPVKASTSTSPATNSGRPSAISPPSRERLVSCRASNPRRKGNISPIASPTRRSTSSPTTNPAPFSSTCHTSRCIRRSSRSPRSSRNIQLGTACRMVVKKTPPMPPCCKGSTKALDESWLNSTGGNSPTRRS